MSSYSKILLVLTLFVAEYLTLISPFKDIILLVLIGIISLLPRKIVIPCLILIATNQRLFQLEILPISIISPIILIRLITEKKYNFKIVYKSLLIVFVSLVISLTQQGYDTFLIAVNSTLVMIYFYRGNTELGLIQLYASGLIVAAILAFPIEFHDIISNPNYRFRAGEWNNSNIYGMSCSLAVSYIMLGTIDKGFRIKDILLVMGLILIIFLTKSRGALLVLSLGTIVWLFKSRMRFRSVVALALIALLIPIIFPSLLDGLLNRILNPRQGDISGGRIVLMTHYVSVILSDSSILLFGVGHANVMADFNVDQLAHNGFIEVIAASGVILLALYLLIFYDFSKRVNSKNHFAILFLVLSSCLTGHYFFSVENVVKLYIPDE